MFNAPANDRANKDQMPRHQEYAGAIQDLETRQQTVSRQQGMNVRRDIGPFLLFSDFWHSRNLPNAEAFNFTFSPRINFNIGEQGLAHRIFIHPKYPRIRTGELPK
jgi:hypothetical protein